MGRLELMKKLLISALAASISSVVANGWLVLDFPSAINDGLLGSSTTPKPHQSAIRQESLSWEEDPTLALWGPDSSYSRVPGKRSDALPISSWGPDSMYSRVPGKRFAPLLMGTWRPDSGYIRAPGKRESPPAKKVQLPWQFDVHMPMIHKRANIWGLDRTVVLPWKFGVGQSGQAIYNTKKWGPQSTKEAEEGEEEVVDEMGKGSLKAMLPWGMNLQSPMLRGKKSYLPLSMQRNMIKNQADSQ